MRGKCLVQEHNAVPWPGLKPRLPDPQPRSQGFSLLVGGTHKKGKALGMRLPDSESSALIGHHASHRNHSKVNCTGFSYETLKKAVLLT